LTVHGWYPQTAIYNWNNSQQAMFSKYCLKMLLHNKAMIFTHNFVKTVAPFIRVFERRIIVKYGFQPLKHQPIFIIGAPRTGSTILYQSLTNLFDVQYINNLTCRFHRNLFFGFWLTQKIFGSKPHDNFKASHGLTYGFNAPSECGQFWYRWLPTDHHFIDFNDITDEMVEQIRLEISAIINYFDKPLVFKNLNAGQRIRLLSKCFPDAKYIFIRRDPVYTVQSILQAKRRLGLSDHTFWSIMPPNVEELKKTGGLEQIAKQVFHIEKQILEDSQFMSRKSLYILDYSEMSTDILINIGNALKLSLRENVQAPDIKPTNKMYLEAREFALLKDFVDSLDWALLRRLSKDTNT